MSESFSSSRPAQRICEKSKEENRMAITKNIAEKKKGSFQIEKSILTFGNLLNDKGSIRQVRRTIHQGEAKRMKRRGAKNIAERG